MFQYEHEKRGAVTSASPSTRRVEPSVERARRPLPMPPRPIHDVMPPKTQVPLKVWIVASASCFAVCGALVLATVAITRWGAGERYDARELFPTHPEPVYAKRPQIQSIEEPSSEELDNEIANSAILSKLPLFKHVGTRDRSRDLSAKPQIHPAHDATHHVQRKIEKKDKPKPEHDEDFNLGVNALGNNKDFNIDVNTGNNKDLNFDVNSLRNNKDLNLDANAAGNNKDMNLVDNGFQPLPDFKPIKPTQVKLPENYINNMNNKDYEDYYNDDILYEDYMQSNTMTSYLIEKVQELHEWVTKDPDFDRTAQPDTKTDFTHLLKALNESLLEGNVSIVMHKLRDMYFGDNFTGANSSRRVILSNSTDLLTFGILSLDVMLLHNIQMMAWENQESARTKMMKDPNVFAFNALFMDPAKVEAKQAEVLHNTAAKRQNVGQAVRQETDDFDIGKNLLENIFEVGMSAARAAIHLGRAYRNARNLVTQMSSPQPSLKADLQAQMSRHLDDNSHALSHLQSSWSDSDSDSDSDGSAVTVTELDCVWLVYCRNLAATAKLSPPFGTMAKINGMALRLVWGGVAAGREFDSVVYEALTGWTPLDCDHMFPKCSGRDAAAVVLASVLQPARKTTARGRGRR